MNENGFLQIDINTSDINNVLRTSENFDIEQHSAGLNNLSKLIEDLGVPEDLNVDLRNNRDTYLVMNSLAFALITTDGNDGPVDYDNFHNFVWDQNGYDMNRLLGCLANENIDLGKLQARMHTYLTSQEYLPNQAWDPEFEELNKAHIARILWHVSRGLGFDPYNENKYKETPVLPQFVIKELAQSGEYVENSIETPKSLTRKSNNSEIQYHTSNKVYEKSESSFESRSERVSIALESMNEADKSRLDLESAEVVLIEKNQHLFAQAVVDEYFQSNNKKEFIGDIYRDLRDVRVKVLVEKAIQVREFFEQDQMIGWEEALMPIGNEERDEEGKIKNHELLIQKQEKTKEFYENLGKWTAKNPIKVKYVKGQNNIERNFSQEEYLNTLKTELVYFASQIAEEKTPRVSNAIILASEDLRDVEIHKPNEAPTIAKGFLTRIGEDITFAVKDIEKIEVEEVKQKELQSRLNKSIKEESANIVSSLFGEGSSLLTLDLTEINNLANEVNDLKSKLKNSSVEFAHNPTGEKQALERVLIISKSLLKTAEYVDIYYKKLMNETIDPSKLDQLREVSQFMMKYVDGDLRSPRKNVAVVVMGDTGSGKGRFFENLQIQPYGAGTTGVAGYGPFHEHFEGIVKSWDVARNNGKNMMHHMPIFFEIGILGARKLVDEQLGTSFPLFLDGYPRNLQQARLTKAPWFKQEDIKVVDVKFRDINEIGRRRIGGHRALRTYLGMEGAKPKEIRQDVITELAYSNSDAPMSAEVIQEIIGGTIGDLTKEQLNAEIENDMVQKIVQQYEARGIILHPNGRLWRYRKDFNNSMIPALRQAGLSIVNVETDNLTPDEAFVQIIDAYNGKALLNPDLLKKYQAVKEERIA
jgi:adenylate kinase family enzyme